MTTKTKKTKQAGRLPISLVITTYNRPEMLARLLAGVARQTYQNFEVILVDDHSSDPQALAKVLAPFRKKFKRFRLLRNDRNRGGQFSRNRGVQAARYPLIAMSDDDDEWMPEKLRLQEELIRKNWESLDLVYCWYELRNHRKGTKEIRRPQIQGPALREILDHCFFQTSSLMIKREKLIEAGPFDESLPNAQDWDMWIRLFQRGCRCGFVPKSLVIYHSHTDSISYRRSSGLVRILGKHFWAFLTHHPGSIGKIWLEVVKRTLGRARRAVEKYFTVRF